MKKLSVVLNGLTPFMADAFRGQEEIPPEQKLYYGLDKKTLILPASNIMGFLTSKSSHSCLRVFISNKDWKTRGPEVVGNVYVDPVSIPFMSDGKPIEFDGKWHRWPSPIMIDSQLWPLAPGARYSGVTIELDKRFKIELTPGRHIVRIAFSLEGVRVVSNPVGIKILPAD